jgi:formamidopyrimidine-DNA glycosylase
LEAAIETVVSLGELDIKLYNMQQQSSHLQNKLQTYRSIQRGKRRQSGVPGHTKDAGEEKYQNVYKPQLVPRQTEIFFLAVQGRKMLLQTPLAEVENIVGTGNIYRIEQMHKATKNKDS